MKKTENLITSHPVLLEVDFADFHIKSSIGIEIASPMRLGMIEYVNCDYKQTWAEKRVKELIWKLKTRNANLNKFIVTILMAMSVVLILGFFLWLATLIRSELTQMMLGILGAQLIIIAYFLLISVFECDPNFIRAKHKGKFYFR